MSLARWIEVRTGRGAAVSGVPKLMDVETMETGLETLDFSLHGHRTGSLCTKWTISVSIAHITTAYNFFLL
jgi:hypothetical protein